jgi:hypothetical protein
MSEIVLGRFVVDLIKLLAKQVRVWQSSKQQDAEVTIRYVSEIADKLDNYVNALVAGHATQRLRYELDRILENLGNTLAGKVNDRLLGQMVASLENAKMNDPGFVISALGSPEFELRRLKGRAREAAIEGLVKAAAEFRAIADSLAIQAGLPPARTNVASKPATSAKKRKSTKREKE